MEPPLSGYRSKKTAAMAHLRMLRRKFVRKYIDWTGRAGSLSQKRSKWAWFCPKVGVASKILRALCTQDCITTPLLEILDPPLIPISSPVALFEQSEKVAITHIHLVAVRGVASATASICACAQ